MRISAGDLIVWLGFVILTGCSSEVVTKPVDLVWPNPPQTPRIKYLRSFSHADEFRSPGPEWVRQLVGEKRASSIERPYAVATDQEGRVYITDNQRAVVWVFEERNGMVRFFGGSGAAKLRQPVGVVVDKRGTIFISDVSSKRVYGFNSAGHPTMALGQKNEFGNPTGLAMDQASGWLYVADSHRHKIQVYNSDDGRLLFEFGQKGSGEGEFNTPTYVAFGNGRLYVCDSVNYRIQIFDLHGKFLKTFGRMGGWPGAFARPRGVAVDSKGHIYVADAVLNNLQIFDDEGRLLLIIGSTGQGPGFFSLPAGIHIDGESKIYVADSYNSRVQIFQSLENKVAGRSLN